MDEIEEVEKYKVKNLDAHLLTALDSPVGSVLSSLSS
jgi:hypothetical protein